MVLRAAEQGGVAEGAPYVEVRRVLPGETDAPVHVLVRVGDLGSHRGPDRLGDTGQGGAVRSAAVRGPGRRTDGGAERLDADVHVGAEVLDRLEGADRTAELLALPGIGDRHLQGALA